MKPADLLDQPGLNLAPVLRTAFAKTLESWRPPLRHLPVPVRFRASGALRAWLAAFDTLPSTDGARRALADPATARRMEALQEGWPVGELELRAAQAALADPDHARRTLDACRRDAPAFVQGLRALGLRPLPSAGPFVLLPLPGSGTDLARSLRPWGILVRTCAEWPGLGDGYVRLALRGRPDWEPLFQGLADWLRTDYFINSCFISFI